MNFIRTKNNNPSTSTFIQSNIKIIGILNAVPMIESVIYQF